MSTPARTIYRQDAERLAVLEEQVRQVREEQREIKQSVDGVSSKLDNHVSKSDERHNSIERKLDRIFIYSGIALAVLVFLAPIAQKFILKFFGL